MDYRKEYEKWLNDDFFDEKTHRELVSIEGDEGEIEDRFYKSLEFGTAGLRGKLGAGTNRMNKYMVSQATQGLADTISEFGEEAKKKGVAISYDVRHKSKEFAEISASVLAANGIKVYIFDGIRPTPVLSYAIRKLKTISGIMVTASHNPRDYNGYKAYWEEGSQILDDIAGKIEGHIKNYDDFSKIKTMDFKDGVEEGIIEYISDDLDEDYLEDVLNLAIHDDKVDKDISIVYTPLNGTGNELVQRVLKERGFTHVSVVKEQEEPDPDFTTVGYPNPEDPKAFRLAEELGHKVGGEILIANDPDADRTALEVLNEDGEYVFVNGNKIGALLVHYILSERRKKGDLPKNPVVVKSIVTGDLSTRIAEDNDVEMKETLTGFKNLCGLANEYEKTGEKNWIFGYEESIGFNYGTFVRDKDAVNSAMMIAEMAGFYKKQGKSLLDVLDDLYEKYGYYNENLISIVLEGASGQERIGRIMEAFREEPIEELPSAKLEKVIDYEKDDTGLPKTNALKYYYDDKSWYALRPSGTEPKIKLYIYSVGNSLEDSERKIREIEETARKKMDAVE
ncbi:MAG: phospho-sugar mutase [Tissierellia bacterium]|nr:phospho-sugar mutase [Tissierellia bacterium]